MATEDVVNALEDLARSEHNWQPDASTRALWAHVAEALMDERKVVLVQPIAVFVSHANRGGAA